MRAASSAAQRVIVAQKRAKQFHPETWNPCTSLSHLSFLESSSVTTKTRDDYVRHVREMVEWCRLNRFDWETEEELDLLVVTYFDEFFWHGVSGSEGSRILAALKFVMPHVSRGGLWHLPRTHRALTSWLKHSPPKQRLPLPWIGLCAILGYLCHHQQFVVALILLVQFRSYVRPGMCDRLKVKQLIPPTAAAGQAFQHWGLILSPQEDGTPGKTGTFDDAVLLDSEPWLDPFFRLLIRGRKSEDPLWPANAVQVLHWFNRAIDELGLNVLQPCRCSLRHGGASDDILTKRRTLLEVKRRGQWRTDQSLRRYGKETKVLSELQKVPSSVVKFGRHISDHLSEVFLGEKSLPPPAVGPEPRPKGRKRKVSPPRL